MRYLKYEQDEDIGILEVHRPEVLNAVNADVLNELIDFVENQAIRNQIKALILTGSGERAFIAGADIKEMHQLDTRTISDFAALGQRASTALEDAIFITIAAVNGYALGGGLELALACDFIYASKNAKMGLPEVSLGLIPGFGGIQRLARAVGIRKARELIMTAAALNAEEAKELGLINYVSEPVNLLNDCRKFAREIIGQSFFSVMQVKLALQEGIEVSRKEALEIEKHLFAMCFDTEDAKKRLEEFFYRVEGKKKLGI